MGISIPYFKKLLNLLNFKSINNNIYTNDYGIEVNFANQKIEYNNNIKILSAEICNFEQKENLVMLECVCRLLQQGYQGGDIVLEPRWSVGHGASGGKADIQVFDKNKKSLLIIECKIYEDFEKYWKKTLIDGDQIFSYYQQDKNTRYAALYTSKINNDELYQRYHLVSFVDNTELLKSIGKDVTGYAQSQSKEETFKVWKNIYNNDYSNIGIFENNRPYDIGKKKFTIDDLKEVSQTEIYEKDKEFKTILRQHNIGNHENAFDKLVNLFLAKIVDESNNKDDLQFNWKGIAYDDVKSLTDRLQKLYKEGMEKFLQEEITYVDKKDIDKAFRFYKNDINATKEAVLDYFDILKYYTNNDFAFLDVHNKKLFEQNAEVLLKFVKMFQGLKLQTAKQNQFLGDLFEGFLDKGVKQSEGQFFTPMPIVKFLVSSLPLENLIKDSETPIKTIDYACGAGHFLTEYANQISNFIPEDRKSEYYKNIVGIEKEYRLSKVAKVSAFMYSQDDINIIYDDALKHNRVKDNDYNILIANPPYAVKGFLETLSEEERNKYSLMQYIDKKSIPTNNDIEEFFVERAKQLLKENGVAAIILPQSILHNKEYYQTRKIILEFFDIIAICEFPTKTFGMTNMKTIAVFLRRKKFPPEDSCQIKDRIEMWYNCDFSKDIIYNDTYILRDYCNIRNIDYEHFIGNIEEYYNEKEKLYTYYLARNQKNPVVTIICPDGSKEIKAFLGYEWINRNKSHRISYLNAKNNSKDDDIILTHDESINTILSPLFNPLDLNDNNKINTIIRNNYNNASINIPDSIEKYVSVLNLSDMINFNTDSTDNSLSTIGVVNIEYKHSKYQTRTLNDGLNHLTIQKGNAIKESDTTNGKIPVVAGGQQPAYYHGIANREKNTITISASGAAGFINFYENPIWASDCITINLSDDNKDVNIRYLYYVLKSMQKDIYKLQKGANQPHVYPKDVESIKIPFPPIDIQNKIVKECQTVDTKIKQNKKLINDCNVKIKKLLNDISSYVKYPISINDFELDIGKRVVSSELDENGEYPVYSANVKVPFGRINTLPPISDFSCDYIIWGIDGDWMVNFMPSGQKFYPTDHCGYLRVSNKKIINIKYLEYAFEKEGVKKRFSRQNRANKEKISNMLIGILLPDIEKQNFFAEQVNKLEQDIDKAEKYISSLNGVVGEILKNYLY